MRPLLAALILLVLAGCSHDPAPSGRQAYLAALTDHGAHIQQGHEGYVLASGYRVCADLADGRTAADVEHTLILAASGPLYPSEVARAIVAQAQAHLCP